MSATAIQQSNNPIPDWLEQEPAATAMPMADGHSRVRLHQIHSAALGRNMRLAVVLPAGYDSAKAGWPVLFLLHGLGRDEQTLLRDYATRAALLNAPFVIVLPQGDTSWYLDSTVSHQRYNAYMQEIFVWSKKEYRLSEDAQKCGVAGWSMGGFGAMRLMELYPDKFSAVATMIGVLDFPYTGAPFPIPENVMGTDPAAWQNMNPVNHVRNLRDHRVFLISARTAFDLEMNERFHHRLNEAEISHQYAILEGGHTFEVVRKALPMVLEYMGRAMALA